MPKKYFIRKDGTQQGPYTLEELPKAGVTPDTYIWCKGMTDWARARHDAEICRMFRQRLSGDHKELTSEADELKDNVDKAPPGFRYFVNEDGTPVDFNEEQPDLTVPPRSRVVEAILVTLFCSIIGFVAVYYAFAAQKAWKRGEAEQAYELTRKAKMWIGVSFFIGMICTGFMLRHFI